MTVDPARLLQLLEPAVRPGATGQPQQAGKPAFENQTFEQLLNGVRQESDANQPAEEPGESQTKSLESLGGLDRIENAGLRAVLANSRAADGSQGNAA